MVSIARTALRRAPSMAAALAAAFAAALALSAGAAAEEVRPLEAAECDKVRRALELGLPFVPGFRRLEFEFPKNEIGIEGHVCRLLTLGTGVHMESETIRSLEDMRTQIRGALSAAGWTETKETARFAETSKHGRGVFALYRNDAVCVSTIVIGVVEGVQPGPEAIKDGKVALGALRPHEREWWLSVDCFGIPSPVGASAEAAPAETARPKKPPAEAAEPAAPKDSPPGPRI